MQIKISEIKIGKRVRGIETLNDQAFEELKLSIALHGLIQPIAVACETPDCFDGVSGKPYNLLAGYRRLMACQANGMQHIDCHIMSLSNDDNMALVELDENLRRKDFSWQEEIKAKHKIYQLVKKKNPKITLKEFSESFLNQSVGLTSTEFLILKFARKHPDILDCKKKSQAFETVNKLREADLTAAEVRDIRTRQAARVKKEKVDLDAKGRAEQRNGDRPCNIGPVVFAPLPKHNYLHPTLYKDAFEMLESFSDHSIDLCVTDPPYGVGVGTDNFGHKGDNKTYKDGYNDTISEYVNIIARFAGNLVRVMKPGSHSYVFCAEEHFHLISQNFESAGFTVIRPAMIWYKTNDGNGVTRSPQYTPGLQYEAIMMLYAPGKRVKLSWPGQGNVICNDPVPDSQRDHPFQKPVALYKDLIIRSKVQGGTFIDPFCGTGSSLIAAMELGMVGHGAEEVKDYRNKFIVKLDRTYGVTI